MGGGSATGTPISMTCHLCRLLFLTAFPTLAGVTLVSLLLINSTATDHTPLPSILSSSPGPCLPLKISPEPIALETLSPGCAAAVEIELHNVGPRPVTAEHLETSCPCLRAEPSAIRIGSGEAGTMTLTYDPLHDLDFRGRLSTDVIGRGSSGGIVCSNPRSG